MLLVRQMKDASGGKLVPRYLKSLMILKIVCLTDDERLLSCFPANTSILQYLKNRCKSKSTEIGQK